MQDPDPLIKPSDVATRIHMSEKTVRRLCASGELDSVRVSPRGLRIRESSVDRLIQSGIRSPGTQGAAA
jgi:hypothetical protein